MVPVITAVCFLAVIPPPVAAFVSSSAFCANSISSWHSSCQSVKWTIISSTPFALRSISTDTMDDTPRVLDDILELTKAFEQVQETTRLNSELYQEKMTEYEKNIEVLESEVSSLKESVQIKNEEIQKQKNLVERNQNEDKIKDLEGKILSAKDSIQLKDEEILKLKENLENAKESVQISANEEKSLMKEQEDLKKKVKELESEVSSLKESVQIKNEEIEKQKNLVEKQNGDKIKDLEGEILSAKDSIQLKDEKILKLKENLEDVKKSVKVSTDEKKSLTKEREDLKRERDNMEKKVNDVSTNFQTEVTKGLLKAANEKENLKSSMASTIEEKDELIKNLEMEIECYESERCSLRKLTVLGLVRFASFFRLRRKGKQYQST